MDGWTDSEKFAKDLFFMTEEDWQRRKVVDRERQKRWERDKDALRREVDGWQSSRSIAPTA